MSSSVASLVGGLVGLSAVGGAVAVSTALLRRDYGYLSGSLAVALDGPVDPLPTVLRYGFAGVELGVRLDEDGDLRLAVAELTGEPEPLFEKAVLVPLAARIESTGRIHRGRRETFLVLVRLVSGGSAEACAVLDEVLTRYRQILTQTDGRRVTENAVRVVLTGGRWPREEIAARRERLVFLDSTVGGPLLPPEVAPLISAPLQSLIGWDPREPWRELPAEVRHLVRSLVRDAHAESLRIRFTDVPDRPRAVRRMFWRELHAAGVDHLGGRDLAALARFLRSPLSVSRPHSHRARDNGVKVIMR